MSTSTTTIRIKFSTKDKLNELGIYGESHDDIIKRLIDNAAEKKKKN